MSQENEVKIKISNGDKLLKTFQSNDYDLIELDIKDTYLDNKLYLYKQKKAFRLRLSSKFNYSSNYFSINIKCDGRMQQDGTKSRKELEHTLGEECDRNLYKNRLITYLDFFKLLGYSELATIDKKRYEYYGFGISGIIVALDKIPKLGTFVEIEGNRDKIQDVIRELGIKGEMQDKSYLEMMKKN